MPLPSLLHQITHTAPISPLNPPFLPNQSFLSSPWPCLPLPAPPAPRRRTRSRAPLLLQRRRRSGAAPTLLWQRWAARERLRRGTCRSTSAWCRRGRGRLGWVGGVSSVTGERGGGRTYSVLYISRADSRASASATMTVRLNTPSAPDACVVRCSASGTRASRGVTSWQKKGTRPRGPLGNVTAHFTSTPSARVRPPEMGGLCDVLSGACDVEGGRALVRHQSAQPGWVAWWDHQWVEMEAGGAVGTIVCCAKSVKRFKIWE